MLSFAPKMKSPGKVFDLLCSEFALAPINVKERHSVALCVFEELTLKTVSGELAEGEESQVNDYLKVLGDLIAADEKYSVPNIKGPDLLKHLLEANNLKQSDLDSIAQPNISSIINGSRPIGWDVAQKLGQRFGLEPAVFMK